MQRGTPLNSFVLCRVEEPRNNRRENGVWLYTTLVKAGLGVRIDRPGGLKGINTRNVNVKGVVGTGSLKGVTPGALWDLEGNIPCLTSRICIPEKGGGKNQN